MSKKILDVVNLSVNGENREILSDINFSVFQGEILSIIGMNGTGKSTLLKAIAGIQKIKSGEIKKSYNKLGYVPQKIQRDHSFPITVFEYISSFHNLSKASIQDALKIFHMQGFIDTQISYLSGGELQKVLIVSALIGKPDLLLLDEPTAGIDVIGEEKFYKNIAEVQQNFPDLAIILVSHNLNMVYKNSDKVICLHEGNFCCHGTPCELKENKQVQEIFGDYVLPYHHSPHVKHSHH